MSGFNSRHGYAPRKPARSPQQIRADWVAAIMRGRAALATPDGAGDLALALTADMRHLAPDNFPIEAWSAREMAKAFLALARVFCGREVGPETRTACAPALCACGEALDGLLTGLRDAEAQTWRHRTGERD